MCSKKLALGPEPPLARGLGQRPSAKGKAASWSETEREGKEREGEREGVREGAREGGKKGEGRSPDLTCVVAWGQNVRRVQYAHWFCRCADVAA